MEVKQYSSFSFSHSFIFHFSFGLESKMWFPIYVTINKMDNLKLLLMVWTILDFQASQQVAKPQYDAKVQPTTLIPKQVGNMYTASLYAAFISLIHNKHSTLVNILNTLLVKYKPLLNKGSCFLYNIYILQFSGW